MVDVDSVLIKAPTNQKRAALFLWSLEEHSETLDVPKCQLSLKEATPLIFPAYKPEAWFMLDASCRRMTSFQQPRPLTRPFQAENICIARLQVSNEQELLTSEVQKHWCLHDSSHRDRRGNHVMETLGREEELVNKNVINRVNKCRLLLL